jgi:ribosomal protein L11 methyltransferase
MSSPSAQVTFSARLTTDRASAERIQDALIEVYDNETVAVSIAELSQDEPNGRWSVALHFRDRPDESAVRALIGLIAGQSGTEGEARRLAQAVAFEVLAPTDWVRKSLEGLTPVDAGRFVVHGAHHRGRVPANRIAVEIDAGLAFGTGHHGSTRGCLLALDRIMKQPGWASNSRRKHSRSKHNRRKKVAVLDVGTGTGVLAIAAAKARRSLVLASDIDPRAVTIARNNARNNGVAAEIMVVHAASIAARQFLERAPFDLVLANILLEPIERFATTLARLVAPSGQVVLSGLLNAQARPALASYLARGFALTSRITLGGWTTLVVTRRGRV